MRLPDEDPDEITYASDLASTQASLVLCEALGIGYHLCGDSPAAVRRRSYALMFSLFE